MILWLNAQLPPSLANWLTATFGVSAVTLRDLGLRDRSINDSDEKLRQFAQQKLAE